MHFVDLFPILNGFLKDQGTLDKLVGSFMLGKTFILSGLAVILFFA